MPITIYHNPKCATSRAALKLLRDHGVEPVIVEYLKTPPSRSELAALLKLLGLKPRALLRAREPEYKKAKLDKPDISDSAILAALVKYPKLLQRPIVVAGDVPGRTSAAKGRKPGTARKAVLGRPPENVLAILK